MNKYHDIISQLSKGSLEVMPNPAHAQKKPETVNSSQLRERLEEYRLALEQFNFMSEVISDPVSGNGDKEEMERDYQRALEREASCWAAFYSLACHYQGLRANLKSVKSVTASVSESTEDYISASVSNHTGKSLAPQKNEAQKYVDEHREKISQPPFQPFHLYMESNGVPGRDIFLHLNNMLGAFGSRRSVMCPLMRFKVPLKDDHFVIYHDVLNVDFDVMKKALFNQEQITYAELLAKS